MFISSEFHSFNFRPSASFVLFLSLRNCYVSRASSLTLDEQLADRLWELSCQAVELQR